MRTSMSGELTVKWFAVATKPRKEAVAALNLVNQGFGVFLPRMRRTVRHSRKSSVRTIPLFPGYLFLEFSSNARWRSVNGTLGAIGILTSGGTPAVVEQGFVEALKAKGDKDDVLDFSADLQVGGRVELVGGPFDKQIGRLAELDDKGRVTVLLEFLAARVPVRTSVEHLLPV
jgi:transcriptional antiterminator RfaH